MSSVGNEFMEELARVRELKAEYESIGSAGLFGVAMIGLALQRADKALASDDVIEILASYKELCVLE